MTDTYQHALPLLEASQSQKHVTVNEALARLDAVAQMRVVSDTVAVPPSGAIDGQAYIVPSGATGAWAGKAPSVAVMANGGWEFLQPRIGWTAWNEAGSCRQSFDGQRWARDVLGMSPGGATSLQQVIEFDHGVGSGTTSSTAAAIPANTLVIGVTARVISGMTGSATSWRLGVSGADNRYGSGLGLALNSYAMGLTGSPVAYYSATSLLMTATGGAFAGGSVRFAIHLLALEPPRAV